MRDRRDIYYIFLDTETTGLPYRMDAPSYAVWNWPRLVQISWLAQDRKGRDISKGSHIIRPDGFTIPRDVARIHGITTERAMSEGIELEEALKSFLRDTYFAECLVCHNTAFDKKVVGCELYRTYGSDPIGIIPSRCTMLESTDWCDLPGFYGEPKWPKLQELHELLFGHGFIGAHDACADVAATARCFWKLRRIGVM